jgi:hypothetical protein
MKARRENSTPADLSRDGRRTERDTAGQKKTRGAAGHKDGFAALAVRRYMNRTICMRLKFSFPSKMKTLAQENENGRGC